LTEILRECYTMAEILKLLPTCYASDYNGRTAFAVVATAAFTGLRLAELRGLRWRDFQGDKLSVERTVWWTKESLPKTESSESTVPLIPILRSFLENYRDYLEGLAEEEGLGKTLKPTDWIFQGERRGTSMNLPNLVRRTIIPAPSAVTTNINLPMTMSFSWTRQFQSGRAGGVSAVRWRQIFTRWA
jgi:integrase